MAPAFLFAWAEAHETTFSAEHHREDEEVFAFVLSQAEGEVAGLDIEIVNPRIGLLAPGRRRWAWLSWRRAPGDVVPLFFGRLVAVPQQLQADAVRLSFLAAPPDLAARLETTADALRQPPWWDPLWFGEDERAAPESVLEARSMLFDVDPVTHEVVATDILTGENAPLVFGPHQVIQDSVQVTHGQTPLARVEVSASVRWDQRGVGTLDLTPLLIEAFGAATPPGVAMVDGEAIDTTGMVVLAAGEAMVRAWPAPGTRIGGGWSVGDSAIGPIGPAPTPAIVQTAAQFDRVRQAIAQGTSQAALALYRRTPGMALSIGSGIPGAPPRTLWVPLWRLAARLGVAWEAARARTETVRFTLEADVQPLTSEPNSDEVARLDLGPVSVDARLDNEGEATETGATSETEPATEGAASAGPIGDPRRASYFKSDRGQVSLAHLIARARAMIRARARAVEVRFEVPFEDGVSLRCRHAAVVEGDPRLEVIGGAAVGKVKHYALTVDGDSGTAVATVTLGCAIGRDGEAQAIAGAPTWSEPGYGTEGYEVWAGSWKLPLEDDVAVADIADHAIDDDGVDLSRITALDYVESLTVTGGLVAERDAGDDDGGSSPFASPLNATDALSTVETRVRLAMRPVTGGPFDTVLRPEVGPLFVPRMVDLEGGDAPTDTTEDG